MSAARVTLRLPRATGTVMRHWWLGLGLVGLGCSPSAGDARPEPLLSTAPLQSATATSAPNAPATATAGASPASASASAAATVALMAPPKREVREPTEWLADLSWSGSQRVAHAKQAKQATVNELFDKAGVTFPPSDVLFRAFKQEAELEVWAGDGQSELKLIATYGICAASGELGPKRNEGDRQVPEGFYQVGYYHPTSSYYLSAQVNYPNASDKVRGGPSPGSDILIHGRCASIGCLSMTDERIEEIYLVGWAAFMKGKPTHVHIFPSRDLDVLLADPKYKVHHDFWRELAPGKKAFEDTHRIPSVKIEKDGRYVVDGG